MITYREIDRLIYLRDNRLSDQTEYFKSELKRFFPYEVEVSHRVYQATILHYIISEFGPRLLHHDQPPYYPEARWDWFENPVFRYEDDAMMFALGFAGTFQ
jgi:hypothetical protein